MEMLDSGSILVCTTLPGIVSATWRLHIDKRWEDKEPRVGLSVSLPIFVGGDELPI